MQIFANMTLDDLKTGMIVTTRNGLRYMVLTNYHDELETNTKFIGVRKNGWITSNGFTANLKYPNDSSFDIVKVEVSGLRSRLLNFEDIDANFETIWEEKSVVKCTLAEIESRLGYKVEIVSEEE